MNINKIKPLGLCRVSFAFNRSPHMSGGGFWLSCASHWAAVTNWICCRSAVELDYLKDSTLRLCKKTRYLRISAAYLFWRDSSAVRNLTCLHVTIEFSLPIGWSFVNVDDALPKVAHSSDTNESEDQIEATCSSWCCLAVTSPTFAAQLMKSVWWAAAHKNNTVNEVSVAEAAMLLLLISRVSATDLHKTQERYFQNVNKHNLRDVIGQKKKKTCSLLLCLVIPRSTEVQAPNFWQVHSLCSSCTRRRRC